MRRDWPTNMELRMFNSPCFADSKLLSIQFLEVKQPPVAIFENVYGAPWGKMQEYIEGRINLADRNDTKAIISGTGKDKKAGKLTDTNHTRFLQ